MTAKWNVVCMVVFFCACCLAQSAGAELRAGVARAEVTPPAGGLMYGYGARGTNVSTGVHDPLFARALVLEHGGTKVAIVALDLGSFPKQNTDRVRALVAEAGDIEHILLAPSHTHSAPNFAEDFPSEESPWVREMERKVAGAILEAGANLEPARIRVGWGEAREGHNRRMIKTTGEVEMFWANRERMPTAPVDYSVGVIRVEDNEGGTVATLVNFACHPVVLGPENLEISADYVGVLTRRVEEEIGGECLFLPGAAGDINPFWDKTPPAEGAFEQVAKMGEVIAEEVLRVTRNLGEAVDSDSLSFERDIVTLRSRPGMLPEIQEIPAEISTLLIGDRVALGFFPGEFFVEHGLRFKNESLFLHTFFVGYTNDALAYFPTIQATTEGAYGAASATRVEVGAGERLVNQALVNLYYQAGKIEP